MIQTNTQVLHEITSLLDDPDENVIDVIAKSVSEKFGTETLSLLSQYHNQQLIKSTRYNIRKLYTRILLNNIKEQLESWYFSDYATLEDGFNILSSLFTSFYFNNKKEKYSDLVSAFIEETSIAIWKELDDTIISDNTLLAEAIVRFINYNQDYLNKVYFSTELFSHLSKGNINTFKCIIYSIICERLDLPIYFSDSDPTFLVVTPNFGYFTQINDLSSLKFIDLNTEIINILSFDELNNKYPEIYNSEDENFIDNFQSDDENFEMYIIDNPLDILDRWCEDKKNVSLNGLTFEETQATLSEIQDFLISLDNDFEDFEDDDYL